MSWAHLWRGSRPLLAVLCACAWFTAQPVFARSATRLASNPEQRIHVGPNILVSKAFQRQTHDEVLLAADPVDPQHLIGCSDIFYSAEDTHTIVYASFDGGLTWRPTLNAHHGEEGDPACALGRNNLAYFATLGLHKGRDGKEHGITQVYTSTDGGRSWPRRVVLPALDREYLTVDVSHSRYSGRLYLNATGGAPDIDEAGEYSFANGIDIYHSIDHGTTFAQPVGLLDVDDHYVLGMGNSAVLSDGTVVSLFGDLKSTESGWSIFRNRANAWLKVVTSHDGGEAFSKASTVDEWHFCNVFTSSAIPMITADASSGPFRNRLYAAWADARSGRCEIYISHSSDKGKTWSAARRVNDDYSLPDLRSGDDFMPLVAVNTSGVVGVAWYDRREFSNNLGYRVRFAASWDGGETFSPSIPIATETSSLTRGRLLQLAPVSAKEAIEWQGGAKRLPASIYLDSFSFIGGHTAGMAADAAGGFHPLWIDNRTGRDQVWTARVAVDGVAAPNGGGPLATFEDITSRVSLDLSQGSFDRRSHILTVLALLKNTSTKALPSVVKMRTLSLTSDMGVLKALNADNALSGAGALWEFSTRSGGLLNPNAHSATRTLRFSLTHVPGISTDPALLQAPQFVHIDAVMLAPRRGRP